MQITDYIHEDNVVFLEKRYKTEVLTALVEKAIQLGYVPNGPAFKAAVEEREAILSTGIGQGIAIPHAKIEGIPEFFVMTGILNPTVAWDALDHKPVGLVFLIGGPDQAQAQYLQLLAKLMGVMKNDEKRASVLAAQTATEVVRLFA